MITQITTGDSTTDTALRFAIVLALGAAWGGYGYLSNVRNDVPGKQSIDPLILGKTMAVGAAAGVLVAMRGDTVSFDTVDATLMVLIPIVDDFLNARLGWTAPTPQPETETDAGL